MQIPHHRRLVFLLFLPGEFLTFGKDVYMRLFTEVPKEQKKESARSAAGRQLEVGSQKTSNSKFLNTFQRQPQSKLAQSRQSRPPTPFHVFFGFVVWRTFFFLEWAQIPQDMLILRGPMDYNLLRTVLCYGKCCAKSRCCRSKLSFFTDAL